MIQRIVRSLTNRANQNAAQTVTTSVDGKGKATLPVRNSTPTPRDPRRVALIGASGRLGREIANALKNCRKQYSIVAVVRSADKVPKGCARSLVRDVVEESFELAEDLVRLGCGTVIWCASAKGGENPRDVDFRAVRDLAQALDRTRTSRVSRRNIREVTPTQHDNFPDDDGWLAVRDDFIELFDFTQSEARGRWYPLNDVIMGGMSSSSLKDGDIKNGVAAVWSGDVTKARGGGFASIRADLAQDGIAPLDLSGCAGIAITCRGDGRAYKLNLKCDDKPEHVFQARFLTTANGEWQTIRIPFGDFVPVIRGKIAYADSNPEGSQFASELDLTDVKSIGLVCSKIEPGGSPCPLFREGPFRLELRRIDAYRATTPRFILVSSAAVTRPFWSKAKKNLYKSAADIPVVKLNSQIGNLLSYKLAGENALRSTSIPCTIVRPTGLAENAPVGRAVNISKGDTAVGRIPRADVARTISILLDDDDATWKTIEISGVADTTWSEMEAFHSVHQDMSRQHLDSEQMLYSDDLLATVLSDAESSKAAQQ